MKNYFNAKIIFTKTAIKTYSNNKVNDVIKVRHEMYGTNYSIYLALLFTEETMGFQSKLKR